MAHATDIVGYTFKADVYCPWHISEAVNDPDVLRAGEPSEVYLDRVAGYRGINRGDEATFDSGEFPKVVFRDMLASCDDCGGLGGDPETGAKCTSCDASGIGDRCGACGEVLGE